MLLFLKKYGISVYSFSNQGNGGFSLRNTRKTYWLVFFFKKRALRWQLAEDSFFTYMGNLLFPFYRLAPESEAEKFSLELHAKEIYIKNDSCMPFGCHAYKRYDWAFWSPIINSCNNNIII